MSKYECQQEEARGEDWNGCIRIMLIGALVICAIIVSFCKFVWWLLTIPLRLFRTKKAVQIP